MRIATTTSRLRVWLKGLSFIVLFVPAIAHAALIVKVDAATTVGTKTIIPITLKNTFKEKVESARATVFLMDDQGKMVGQATKWVIGGTKDRSALEPDKETTFNFVISTDKRFKTSKVTFSRIVLEGGKLADVTKEINVTTTGQ
jgi:methionine-rich copper-binding protein CopC